MLLNINPVMSSMFNAPAATASTVRPPQLLYCTFFIVERYVQIVACRVVRRLFQFGDKQVEMR